MESFAKFIVLSNSGRKSLEETLGLVEQGDIVEVLQELLKLEYLQKDVYESYQYLLLGPEGISVAEHLDEHYDEETAHVRTLQRYLVSLGAIPTLERYEIPKPETNDLAGLMKLNYGLENDAVERYSVIAKGLENLNDSRHVALINDLQTIASEETEHSQDLGRWLRTDF